jgi:hypothetical protein
LRTESIVIQFVSQHLAGGIARDRRDGGDVPRLFKARHLVLQILPQFGFVDVGARAEDYEGSEPLAEVLIRNTDDRMVDHVGMFAKGVLNRAGGRRSRRRKRSCRLRGRR